MIKQVRRPETILFEPWNLGDVIIAASVLRELPYPAALACHPNWHSLLRSALPQKMDLSLIPIELPYTTRGRSHAFEFSSSENDDAARAARLVLSIRGDLRDYFAARRLFPLARIRMSGWIRFLARKNSLIDFPYAHGLLPIENRYRSWAKLLGIPFRQIESTYAQNQGAGPKNRRVIIHFGAQWRSKQFPHVLELSEILRDEGYEVVLVAGQSDLLPPKVTPESVVRAENQNLVTLFRSAEQVITNDSGPMHLATFLGCRTTTIARTSSVEEWVPPATRVVAAEQTPRGYRQRKSYMSDEILPDWPSAMSVAQALTLA
jgi:glycosyl transferase family 9 (putative heptosyltransferase)